ncbi:hypothetical protein FQN50_004744 [Emmonsiellopsis sp. PD_5]|nr:hypothetical protein FQN50_004744 [Emmonsiellopsis sp. PD_5]
MEPDPSSPETSQTASAPHIAAGFDEPADGILSFVGEPGDVPPSGDHGILEVLEITKVLENAGVCCCLVGICALRYFGAMRVRHDWEICVPTDLLETAAHVFNSEPHNQTYKPCRPKRLHFASLYHTFPRFKIRGVDLYFVLIPDDDAYIHCIPSNIERSQTGLPYPKLPMFAQSLLETDDEVALTDLVDGMDLSEEWGRENLDLDGIIDNAWAVKKNDKIRATVPLTETSCLLEHYIRPASKEEVWKETVSKKEHRIGPELPKEYFSTRFHSRDLGDPRLLPDRTYV